MRILVRGGGDLASGAVLRLVRAGWQVLVTELAQPRAVRRTVSFAQAVFDGSVQVEEVTGLRVESMAAALQALAEGTVPVMVDPAAEALAGFQPQVLIDARMGKRPPELDLDDTCLMIGLGPGFTAGENCHAVIETNRGPDLGRVIWRGGAEPDTGVPERVGLYRTERVLRAPADGRLETVAQIGQVLPHGALIARVSGHGLAAPFAGVLRGLLQDGLPVRAGEKIGDLDPRGDPRLCYQVSDKALSVGGAVLEAILTWKAGKAGPGAGKG